jgi:hypothetical protein
MKRGRKEREGGGGEAFNQNLKNRGFLNLFTDVSKTHSFLELQHQPSLTIIQSPNLLHRVLPSSCTIILNQSLLITPC